LISDLPTPIAIYIDAENRGDTEALAQCFTENAVVRDEGQTIEGLAAIKQWKAETKKKYQQIIEPLASAQKDDKTIVTNMSIMSSQSSTRRSSRGDTGMMLALL
jgi:ketosteroid isomerase-like protein